MVEKKSVIIGYWSSCMPKRLFTFLPKRLFTFLRKNWTHVLCIPQPGEFFRNSLLHSFIFWAFSNSFSSLPSWTMHFFIILVLFDVIHFFCEIAFTRATRVEPRLHLTPSNRRTSKNACQPNVNRGVATQSKSATRVHSIESSYTCYWVTCFLPLLTAKTTFAITTIDV